VVSVWKYTTSPQGSASFRAPSGYATATLAPSKGRFQVDHVDRIDIAGIAALIADNGNIALGAHLDCVGPEPSNDKCRLLTGQQRRDTAHGDTAVLLVGSLHRHLELLLTVALRGQVFGRNLELFGQRNRNRLRAAVRE
jgi:hypothetical protein